MHYDVCVYSTDGEGGPGPSGLRKGSDVFAGVMGGWGTGKNAGMLHFCLALLIFLQLAPVKPT